MGNMECSASANGKCLEMKCINSITYVGKLSWLIKKILLLQAGYNKYDHHANSKQQWCCLFSLGCLQLLRVKDQSDSPKYHYLLSIVPQNM